MAKSTIPFVVKRPRSGRGVGPAASKAGAAADAIVLRTSTAVARQARKLSLFVSTANRISQRALARDLELIIREVSTTAATVSVATLIEKAGALNFASMEKPADAQQLLERTPIRRLDLVQERLQQRMVYAVLSGTPWLSSAEVGALGQGGVAPANPHARASRLVREGRVFAIERAGRSEFPRYAFDALGNPYPAVRDVLQVFAGWPALRVASWFESASAALDGKRPRELLELDPQAVVRAAREHAEGPVHG